MAANQMANELAERGWADVPFSWAEGDRAEYAGLAHSVIGLALEDEAIRNALKYDLSQGHETGAVRTGDYGISTARNSGDDKVTLHAGYQTRNRVEVGLPVTARPRVLREFLEVNDDALFQVERAAQTAFYRLGAWALGETVFTPKQFHRNVIMRTVRYRDAVTAPVGTEVVKGHADLGLATLHLYETHGGWLKAAPYPWEVLLAEDSPDRREAVQTVRTSLQPIEQHPADSANFFLGASWHNFTEVPDNLRDLPACYHAGFRPSKADEVVSPYAAEVTGGENHRVSVISFLNLHPARLRAMGAIIPTVSNCRPEF